MFLFYSLFFSIIAYALFQENEYLPINFKTELNISSCIISLAHNDEKMNISIDISNENNFFINSIKNGSDKEVFLVSDNRNSRHLAIELIMQHINKSNSITTIGLSRGIDNSLSLIDELYDKKYITKKQFSLLYSYPNWGTLSIGEDDEHLKKLSLSLSDHVPLYQTKNKKLNKKWTVMLNGIMFGEEGLTQEGKNPYHVDSNITRAAEVNIPMYFSTVEPHIIVPCEIIDYFEKYYFINHIKEGSCRKENENGIIFFRCRKSVGDVLEIVHFIFGNLDLVYSGKRLFNNQGQFSIMCKKGLKQDFIFGYYFLKNYHVTFSYETDTVSFFSLLGKIKIEKIEYMNHLELNSVYNFDEEIGSDNQITISLTTQKYLLSFTSVISIFGLGILILFYVKIINK